MPTMLTNPYTVRRLEQWITSFGPNTCLTCATLHGQVFPAGVGPMPPLHPRCACHRQLLRIDYEHQWRSVPMDTWQKHGPSGWSIRS